MTRDDIIRMAREAGFDCDPDGHIYTDHADGVCTEELERFAALVAAAAKAEEREACAKVAEDSDHVVGGRGYHDQLGDADATVRNITAAIRARGETK